MMNKKGQAGIVMVLLLVFVILYFMIAVLGGFWGANTDGCYYDVNGTLHNCSLSPDQYDTLNQTDTYVSKTVGVGSGVMIFMGGILVVFALFAFKS